MPLPVQLKDVASEMDLSCDESQAYINRKTGELLCVPTDFETRTGKIHASSPEWQVETAKDCNKVLNSEDFVALPSQRDIHEYAIIESFCHSVANDRHRERLLGAIAGKGAFRRFKDLVQGLGIEQDWYRYRDEAFKRIAAEFLEAEGIAYVDESSAKTP
jgi:hypothetical protein